MLIKWGALVVDGRGKIGGQVASKNRTGAYMRNKVTPVNPRTNFQQEARQQLGNLSSQWRALTESQRDAWRNAVSQYEKTNIFGDKVQPTGKNLFVGLNRNLSNIGEPIIDTPASPQDFPVINITDIVIAPAGQEVTLNPAELPSGFEALFYATPPQSVGKNFVESEFRMIGTTLVELGTGVYDLTALYTERFGAPVAGQKVFVRVVLVSTVSGQRGTPVQASAIVA